MLYLHVFTMVICTSLGQFMTNAFNFCWSHDLDVGKTEKKKKKKWNHIILIIIQHIDTLPKYGKMILDICHLHMTDNLRYLSSEWKKFFYETSTNLENRDSQNLNKS
jgi:hypothetical protein